MLQIITELTAIAVGWAAALCIAYFMVRWCFDGEFSYKKAFQWIMYVFVGIALMVVVYCFLPQRIQDIFNIVANHLMCGAAVHVLLLRADKYLEHQNGIGVAKPKLYLGTVVLYVLMALNGFFVLSFNSHFVVEIAQVAVTYLTRGAILMTLILEIKLRGKPEISTIENLMEEL
jgi:hypothetical protein